MKIKLLLIAVVSFIATASLLLPLGMAITPQLWYFFLLSAICVATSVFLLLYYGIYYTDKRYEYINRHIDELTANMNESFKQNMECLSSSLLNTLDKLSAERHAGMETLYTLHEKNNAKVLASIAEMNNNLSDTITKSSQAVEESFKNLNKQYVSTTKELKESVNQNINRQIQVIDQLSTKHDNIVENSQKKIYDEIIDLKNTISKVSQSIAASEKDNINQLTSIFTQSNDKLSDDIISYMNRIDDAIAKICDKQNSMIESIVNQYETIQANLHKREEGFTLELGQLFEDNVNKQLSNMIAITERMTEHIRDFNIELMDKIISAMNDSVTTHQENIANKIRHISQAFQDALDSSLDSFNTTGEDIRNSLHDMEDTMNSLQTTLGGDLVDNMAKLSNYLNDYQTLKKKDVEIIKTIENLCQMK